MVRHFLDISRPLSQRTPAWPGDPPVHIEMVMGGDGSMPVVRRLTLSSHTGTHVDPPAHFIADGLTVDQLPLELLVGPAWLTHLSGPGPISAGVLETAGVPDGVTRLLIRTRNSDAPADRTDFDREFVALDHEAAHWLVNRGIRLVGIDGPSIAAWDHIFPAHLALLEAGIVVVEGLYLRDAAPGAHELICLPLAIAGGDGAPARVVLVRDA
jgi:arylformamidase